MTETPPWWPAGVELRYIKECNCYYCADLLDGYAEWRQDRAGEYRTLDAF